MDDKAFRFSNPKPTNQKAGSSNLSGRTILKPILILVYATFTASIVGEKGCGKVQTTFPLHLEIPQTRRDSHFPTATATAVPSPASPRRFRTKPRVLTYGWTKKRGQVRGATWGPPWFWVLCRSFSLPVTVRPGGRRPRKRPVKFK